MNPTHGVFSLAQCMGYLSMALGVAAFLQRSDTRLKMLSGIQSLIYGVHFMMMGAPPAAVSAALSGVRTLWSIKTRSAWVAALMIVLMLGLGLYFNHGAAGLLPIAGSVVSTFAFFFMRGVPMRLVLFSCTVMWLANNIIAGSYGGIMLELFVLISNATTMGRMFIEKRRDAAAESVAELALETD